MPATNTPVRSAKAYYSEAEAARSLEMGIPEFRDLVRRHIIEREEDMSNVDVTTFHPADLLLLRMLTGRGLSGAPIERAEPVPNPAPAY